MVSTRSNGGGGTAGAGTLGALAVNADWELTDLCKSICEGAGDCRAEAGATIEFAGPNDPARCEVGTGVVAECTPERTKGV
mmetsp:Transcript_81859/g.171232  ORF Transcript_81859/g.171232 Transcript_81859/m.171232 type:complete len:81 (+) Transcript_81859:1031-1273(+)